MFRHWQFGNLFQWNIFNRMNTTGYFLTLHFNMILISILYITYQMTKSFFYIGCHIDTLGFSQSQMRSLSHTTRPIEHVRYHHGYLYIRKSDNNPTILLFEILALNGARNMDITEWSKRNQSIAICSLSREFKTRKHNSNSV